MALETSIPADFDAPNAEAQLNALRDKVPASSKIAQRTVADHHGQRIERNFDGDTLVNGERIAYETWPLLENPWMRQEWNGNLTLKNGSTTRFCDVTQGRIHESTLP